MNQFTAGMAGAIALGLLAAAMPAQAQEQFSNDGILFEVDTVVEFEFLESNAVYQSRFGVVNLDTGDRTVLLEEVKPADQVQAVMAPSDFEDDSFGGANDFLGTPGNTVPQPLAEFEFEANTRYGFFLESTYNGRPAGVLYSIDARNEEGRQVMFEGGLAGLAAGGTVLRWDDTGSLLVRQGQEDRDFDDFIVRAGGHLDCPFNQAAGGEEALMAQVTESTCAAEHEN